MTNLYGTSAKPTDFDDEQPKLQRVRVGNDIPYEHHCRGKYEGIIFLHDMQHELCPTCKGFLGKNGCDLEKACQ